MNDTSARKCYALTVRIGCGGCLSGALGVGLIVGVGFAGWGAARALEDPGAPTAVWTPADASAAQQKLFRLLNDGRGAVALSEGEVNAFVTRNIDARYLPLERPVILLRDGDRVELVGRLSLRALLAGSALSLVTDILPGDWLEQRVRLGLLADVSVEREPRPRLRLDVSRVTVGRQRLPAMVAGLFMIEQRSQLMRLSIPPSIEEVRIERGRATIRAASPRART
jgi:hypothetical protein